MPFTPTIGLEIHAQLNTKSKMFCSCSNAGEDEPPNTTVCPICMAHPGTLPYPNKNAIEKMLQAAMALNCQILKKSKFDRKNYFYPDLPKGYQISQYDLPFSEKGFLEIGDNKIRITRIHLEEDTGKLVHAKDGSLVDYNRAGTPLMELVTEPDLKSGKEAKEFCQELQLIFRYLDVSEANMEKGQMRCEVNISLREIADQRRTDAELRRKESLRKSASSLRESATLGTKVEIKNLNSFRAVERSIDYEIKRQTKALKAGEKIIQETRGWDEAKQKTISQRAKEEAHDYRYFPEPDLPVVSFDKDAVIDLKKLKSSIPELPQAKRKRFQEQYGINAADAKILTADKTLAHYTENVISELKAWLLSLEQTEGSEEEIWEKNKKKLTKLVTGWLINKLGGILTKKGLVFSDLKITPENFAEFITLIFENRMSGANALKVLEIMVGKGGDPSYILEEKGFAQVTNQGEVEKIIDEVIKTNPDPVAEYKQGKTATLQFLIGQVMRRSEGKANPAAAKELLEKKLI